MSNSFYLSNAPEIAAIKAVVDSIRTTDVPVLTGGIATIAADTGNMRTIDFPNTDAAIAALAATQVTIFDQIVAARTTDLPLADRGQFKINYSVNPGVDDQTLLSITGTGKLIAIHGDIAAGSVGGMYAILDGITINPLVMTANAENWSGIDHEDEVAAVFIESANYHEMNLIYRNTLIIVANNMDEAATKIWIAYTEN